MDDKNPKGKRKRNNLNSSRRISTELDSAEEMILLQDVKERVPDPVKLILLRDKMETITQLMDNLHSMRDNTAQLKLLKKKEKNRLASKCCRLKKKALFEANLIILNGLINEKGNSFG